MNLEPVNPAHQIKEKNRLEQEWRDYQNTPITRDTKGNGIIKLTGKLGEGMQTLVPDKVWHQLTYKTSWNFFKGYARGHWQGHPTQLHRVIFNLCYPDVVVQGSVDHINPIEKLNNLESNLRDASAAIQAYNKQQKAACTSQYIGVSFHKTNRKWVGRINHNKQRYTVGSHYSEHDAARALNQKAKELKGEYARLLIIADEL